MKRLEPESIGDVLRQTLQEQGMTERLYEARAVAVWPAVVGDVVASNCARPSVTRGVMTVKVENAPLRQDLNMNRSTLRRLINEALQREVITEVKFI